ncbi:MAG TPA: hypothetical protein VF607_01830 [Verrucomicrobiae bacterium]
MNLKLSFSLGIGLVGAVLAGCQSTMVHRTYEGLPRTEFDIHVSCSEPSQNFMGTVTTDGHPVKLSGTGQNTYHFIGHELSCAFKQVDAQGMITLSVEVAGQKIGTVNNTGRFGGVRAEILRTPTESHEVFTTY